MSLEPCDISKYKRIFDSLSELIEGDFWIDPETDNISTNPPSRAVVIGHVMRATHGSLNPKLVDAIIDGVLDEVINYKEKLLDPNAVHVNMLRGKIARPTETQIKHLYPELFKDGK